MANDFVVKTLVRRWQSITDIVQVLVRARTVRVDLLVKNEKGGGRHTGPVHRLKLNTKQIQPPFLS